MKKKSTFARNSLFEGVKPTPPPTQVYTPNNTQEYTQKATPELEVRVRKDRRVQLLMESSLVDELDAYAKKYNTNRSEIIQAIVKEFLKNNG